MKYNRNRNILDLVVEENKTFFMLFTYTMCIYT